MRFIYLILVCCFLANQESFGGEFTNLAGDLPRVVAAEKSPYLVSADIYVPAGKTVQIEAGAVLLFKNFTSLHVQGVLRVKGTSVHPVIFTSESDRTFNPESDRNPTPYDWNGIYIHKDGIGTEMEKFKIMYSVKGIISETKFVRISDGTFIENGRSNLSIEGQEKQITANELFSYKLSVKDARVDGVPIRILEDPFARKRTIFRYSGLAFCVGGSALGAIFGNELRTSQKKLVSLSSTDSTNLIHNGPGDWDEAYDKRNRDILAVAGGVTAVLLGAIAFTWSFSF